jgi:hypothetical protein
MIINSKTAVRSALIATLLSLGYTQITPTRFVLKDGLNTRRVSIHRGENVCFYNAMGGEETGRIKLGDQLEITGTGSHARKCFVACRAANITHPVGGTGA